MKFKIFKSVFLFVFVQFFLILPGFAESEKKEPVLKEKKLSIAIRFMTGLGYLQGGELNDGIKGDFEYRYQNNPEIVDYKYQDLHFNIEFGADILINLKKNYGIAIGATLLKGKRFNTLNQIWDEGIVYDKQRVWYEPKIQAIPITLGFFYLFPLSKSLNFIADAGVGYNLTRLRDDRFYEVNSKLYWFRSGYQTAFKSHQYKLNLKADGIGFHASITMEIQMNQKIFLFIKTQGRYAKIGGYEGIIDVYKSTSETSSLIYSGRGNNEKLWIYTTIDMDGHTRDFFTPDNHPPVNTIYTKREAKIDFSGVSLFAGIGIRL